jgi:hypothetical protein
MGYGLCGPMGYGQHFPANQLGGWLKLWGKRGYGLRQVWVKRGLTVYIILGPRVMVGEPCYQSGQILGEIREKAGSQSGQNRIFF